MYFRVLKSPLQLPFHPSAHAAVPANWVRGSFLPHHESNANQALEGRVPTLRLHLFALGAKSKVIYGPHLASKLDL
eukprot:2397506-Amphidinium_carterae.1